MPSTDTAAPARDAAPAATPPGEEERQLTLSPEEAFELALQYQREGRVREAVRIYEVLHERWPEHVGVLNRLGVARYQLGEPAAGLALLQRAVELEPGDPDPWNNLGNVLLRQERLAEAEDAMRQSLALRESPGAHANLSRVLRKRGDWVGAEASCHRALALDSEFGDAWHDLSLVLLGTGRIEDGVRAACRALTLLPPQRRRRDSHIRALVLLGENERAAQSLREWLAEEPDNAWVRHHLAACAGAEVPARASDEYVERVFDDFASDFDAKLTSLKYRAPDLVVEAVRIALGAPQGRLAVADLGCGTGWCGPLVRPWADRLVGCDLSAGMLSLAEQRQVYDELHQGELVAFLRGSAQRHGLLISADTLCYFGDLADVVRASRDALRPGGVLVFTVEAWTEAAGCRGPSANDELTLQPCGRYAHTRAHLERVLPGAGLRVLRIQADILRQEGGRPVHGWVVTAERPD